MALRFDLRLAEDCARDEDKCADLYGSATFDVVVRRGWKGFCVALRSSVAGRCISHSFKRNQHHVPGTKYQVPWPVPGTWYLARRTWLVPGTRYQQVPGTSYPVPGTRYLGPCGRYQVAGTWHMVPVTFPAFKKLAAHDSSNPLRYGLAHALPCDGHDSGCQKG